MEAQRLLQYPGSKWSIAEWIVSHMPEHTSYLEPFFGSGAVLFNKPVAPLETINDVDENVTNFFRVVRDRPDELERKLRYTPYARSEYLRSYEPEGDEVERARLFLVRLSMAMGAKTSDSTGWRFTVDYDARPLSPAVEWTRLPDRIQGVADRLRTVQIDNQTAVEQIARHRHTSTLIYCDPPYLMSTRSRRMYAHEMGVQDHEELLAVLQEHPGPVMISGYAHPMYDGELRHWHRHEHRTKAQGGKARTEVLWLNPKLAELAGRAQQLTLDF